MPVLSDKRLEMTDIGDINTLMLSHQVTTQQRTHIIRQKTVPLGKIPHAILEGMLYSGYSGRGMHDSGLSLSYSGPKFMWLFRVTKSN